MYFTQKEFEEEVAKKVGELKFEEQTMNDSLFLICLIFGFLFIAGALLYFTNIGAALLSLALSALYIGKMLKKGKI